MDQIFATFGVEWKILVVQMVNFGVLLAIMWYILYRPLVGFIDKRRTDIIEGVAKAERAETMLYDAQSKKAGIITEATLKADEIITQARASGKTKEEILVKLAEEKASRLVAEARQKSEEMKRQTLAESEQEIAKMVVLGVEKMLRERA